MGENADFVVLHPDGTVVYGCGDIHSMMDALGVDRVLLDIGAAGRVQVWHVDARSGPNQWGERVLTAVGYRRPTDWMGPIALTTRTYPFQDVAPLAADVRVAVEELVTPVRRAGASAAALTTETVDAMLPPGPDSTLPEGRADAVGTRPDPLPPPVPDTGVEL
ncbi:hypothetical protein ACWDSJ_26130 [Nocardia sp. NPDC003482]